MFLAKHFPSQNITIKLNQPQLYYPERRFKQHYAGANAELRKATSTHAGFQLFQVVFLMRKYRNAGILCEHIAKELGLARSQTMVLRHVEHMMKCLDAMPGMDTGVRIKVSGRINGKKHTAANMMHR